MKKVLFCMIVMLTAQSLSTTAQAGLMTIGTATYDDGTGDADYNLIWDDDNNGNSVVWLDFTSRTKEWATQLNWASGLNGGGVLSYNINPGYAVTWNGDWRLPTTPNVWGGGKTDSELGHLYHTELGNTTTGLINTGDFQELVPSSSYSASIYWTAIEYDSSRALRFNFRTGVQAGEPKDYERHALAVRSGEVVPEPATVALLGIGLVGLAGAEVRRRRKKKAVANS